MYLSEELNHKWSPVLDHKGLPQIGDDYRRAVTALVLENQQKAMQENSMQLSESAPTNSTGNAIANYDPILISLIRRALPNLIAYDICGVQAMTGPVGLIFAIRSRYKSQTGAEAFYREANSAFSGTNALGANGTVVGAYANTNPVLDLAGGNTAFGWATGMTTAQAEALGDVSTNQFAEMAFSIEKVSVTARSRALKAEYSMEAAHDIKTIHGLDMESELSNLLSTAILTDINREVIRTIYGSAVIGARYGVTTQGTYDLNTDSNGRWSVEKFKGLIFQIERECNAIAKATRMGKGNILIVSADVASALSMAEVLDYTPALKTSLQVDDTGSTFAGTIHGKIKVYIDPYFEGSENGDELCTVGYKGTSPFDAGLFYCPYVPLQMVRAIGQDTFQPKIGFKTRYGMVANPFSAGATASDGTIKDRSNVYYRIFRITNLS
jgi:hypothetical protein